MTVTEKNAALLLAQMKLKLQLLKHSFHRSLGQLRRHANARLTALQASINDRSQP